MKQLIFAAALLLSGSAFGQSKFTQNELSVNGFRNPSIGLEYHYHQYSVHAGYYTTAFKKGEFTNFFKLGYSLWFLPTDDKPIPSSFYSGGSYMRGLNRDYKDKNAMSFEVGYRWMVWKGLNLRMGVIAVTAKDESMKINPTPAVSYSFAL